MYHDLKYNTKKYVSFTADELIGVLVTSLFIAFALRARDLLFERFWDFASLQDFVTMFLFVFGIMFAIIWACKIVAVSVGHVIVYKPYFLALIVCAFITVMTAGYLPIFLPGGFFTRQPERLTIGKSLGFRKGWELGLIAGSFPLFILLIITILSPVYLWTRADLYAQLMVACCLIAIFACVPAPMFDINMMSRKEWFRGLYGTTFGLEVVYASIPWYFVLTCTVLLFSALTYILTLASVRVGFWVYIICLVISALTLFIYPKFFTKKTPPLYQ